MNADMSDCGKPADGAVATSPLPDAEALAVSPSCPPVEERPSVQPAKLWRVLGAVWKLTLGAIFCQSFFLSILVVGWLNRAMQRAVLKAWWRVSPARRQGTSFVEFTAQSAGTMAHASWPNWLLAQPRTATGWTKHLAGSLVQNAKLGAQTIFNVWMLTLPGCLIWWFAWYDGWQNSFNKGYEQAFVGPATFGVGIVLFIAALFYLPMALARQASTGQWRAFYQWRLNWALARRRWLSSLGLAIFCVGLSLPVAVLKSYPFGHPQAVEAQIRKLEKSGQPVSPDLRPVSQWTAAEQLQWMRRYWFFSTLLYVFPAFVLLRLAMARVYAGSVLDAVQRGALTEEQLAEAEWEALHRLELLTPRTAPIRHPVWRIVAWLSTRTGRVMSGIATALILFLLVAQIVVGEFFVYHDWGRGWWNQPLVQLPWFNYTPAHLVEKVAHEERP